MEPQSNFEDPALKAALKRACGQETAPPALRARIQAALAAEQASAWKRAAHPPRSWRNSPLVGLAAAAIILLSFAWVYTQYIGGPGGDLNVNLPQALAQAMIKTADQGTAGVESNLAANAASPDYAALKQKLEAQLNHPALAASIGADWKLASAGMTQIAGVPASELVFTRGDQSVSLFSVSGARFYATQEGSQYDQVEAGHAIAGFVHKGTVHCVVGQKNVSAKEIGKIRDGLRKVFADARDGSTGSAGACGGAPSIPPAAANSRI
jgi:hypothetical protein